MNIELWAIILISVYAIMVSIFLFWRNPLPFPDNGHRGFCVANEYAAKILVSAINEVTGIKERFTFDPGSTHQTLLWDNTTVIIWFDEEIKKQELDRDFISFSVPNPKEAAEKFAGILREKGYSADIKYNILPESGNKFVLLQSNMFPDKVITFRKHILKMGKPPKKRRLLQSIKNRKGGEKWK